MRALLVVLVLVAAPVVAPVVWTVQADDAAATADARDAVAVADGTTDAPARRALLSARRLPEALLGPLAERRLADDLDTVVARLDGEVPSSCLVVRLDGTVVRSVRDDIALIPASTQKLLTAAAVLDTLGPATRFTTEVLGPAPVAGVVEGDLFMVGGGDPVLSTAGYAATLRDTDPRTPLEDLADAVVAAGVTQVTGAVVGDDSRYDRARSVASWPARYVDNNNAGPLSALSVDDGFAEVSPLERAEDPAAWAARALTGQLTERGVVVDGEPRSGTAPGGLGVLAAVESAPVAEIVAQMLRASDNDSAELLVKELGLRAAERGSTQAGTDRVEAVLAADGLPTAGVDATDGSGLDRGNRVTCALLEELVVRAGPASVIGEGLAVAGESGTLAGRFDDTPVEGRLHAKTGFLNGVHGLAGYVDPVVGQDALVTFALVVNDVPLDSPAGTELQNVLAQTLVRHPDVPDLSDLEP